MKSELTAILGGRIVNKLNIAAQILVLLVSSIGFYEVRSYRLISKGLKRLAKFQKIFWFGMHGLGIGMRPAEMKKFEDFPQPIFFIMSALIIAFTIASGKGVIYWALYPLRQFLYAVSVWANISIAWASLLIPIKSLLYLLWGVLLIFLVYPGGFGIPIKSFLFLAEWLSGRLSEKVFHLILFATFVVASIIVIVTSMNQS